MAISAKKQLALIAEMLAIHEPAIQNAFLEAIRDARKSINLQAVIDALTRGDLAGAANAADFSATFFAPLDMAIQNAYYDNGRALLSMVLADGVRAGVNVNVRFNPGDQQSAEWLRTHSSGLITDIMDDQRQATREALAAGMLAGQHPRTVALDVVGRVNKVTKQREGGVIGITGVQESYLRNAREELGSGDPKLMRHYLTRKLRDRRYDPMVLKAIREGRKLPAAEVTKISGKYSDRLLRSRGQTIGRTESLTAQSFSQEHATQQLVRASGLRPDQIESTWVARIADNTRDWHIALHEKTAPADGFFVSPKTGALMRFPRDSEHGARGADIINCRCARTFKVNWRGAKAQQEAQRGL